MILVVGMNLAWQKVGHLPALHRGEVNRLTSLRAFASGKSVNVVRALPALGGDGEALGYAGGRTGALLAESVRAEGLSCGLVTIAAETRTCTTLAEPDGSCTEVIEPSPRVTEQERALMKSLVAERLPRARLLVISGTTPEGETDTVYAEIARAAHDLGLPVVLDTSCPRGRRALAEGPEVLKVNAQELASLSGMPTGSLEERGRACRGLARQHGVRWFVITRGAAGIEAFSDGAALYAPAPRVAVANAIGSGDAAAAGAAWVLHEAGVGRAPAGYTPALLREALLTAAAMGTANCLNPVNGRVSPEDYLAVRGRVAIETLPMPTTTVQG
jgi:1-phosphofructokinase family hexose kinase